MKRFLSLFLVLGLLLLGVNASAQQGSWVTIAPTPSVSVSPYVPGTIADEGAINKQLTVTITPPSGQYFYLTNLEYSACSNATGLAMTNALFTQTGFTWLPINQVSIPAASVNTCGAVVSNSYGANPVKSKTPGATVTFVSPAANAQVAFTLHAFGFFAP